MMTERRVVVTGLGVVGPLGIGAKPMFDALLAGQCGIDRLAAFDPAGFGSQVAGEAPKLKMGDHVPKAYRKFVKVMAPDIELAVAAAHEATLDADLRTQCLIARGEAEGPTNIDPARLGANIGAGLICADLNELAGALSTSVEDGQISMAKWGREGMQNLTPLWLLKFLPNMLACHVTIVHDCQGASNTITCSEASSHLAIGEAFRAVARGAIDASLCGGAESKVNPMSLVRQDLMGRLTTKRNDDPAGACRPFDADRAGTVVSEGGGLIVLEALDHAKARGAKVYAEMIGFGAGSNANGWSQPHPEGRGLAVAVSKALADAAITPEQVDLVVAAGFGLVDHDASEARGLLAALGGHGATVPVMAIKGAVGNCGAGSGAIDYAMACMAIHEQAIPASQNTDNVDPACGLNVVRGQSLKLDIKTVLTVSYAVDGGQNAAAVLRRVDG